MKARPGEASAHIIHVIAFTVCSAMAPDAILYWLMRPFTTGIGRQCTIRNWQMRVF